MYGFHKSKGIQGKRNSIRMVFHGFYNNTNNTNNNDNTNNNNNNNSGLLFIINFVFKAQRIHPEIQSPGFERLL